MPTHSFSGHRRVLRWFALPTFVLCAGQLVLVVTATQLCPSSPPGPIDDSIGDAQAVQQATALHQEFLSAYAPICRMVDGSWQADHLEWDLERLTRPDAYTRESFSLPERIRAFNDTMRSVIDNLQRRQRLLSVSLSIAALGSLGALLTGGVHRWWPITAWVFAAALPMAIFSEPIFGFDAASLYYWTLPSLALGIAALITQALERRMVWKVNQEQHQPPSREDRIAKSLWQEGVWDIGAGLFLSALGVAATLGAKELSEILGTHGSLVYGGAIAVGVFMVCRGIARCVRSFLL